MMNTATLKDVVENRDLDALESIALTMSYGQLIKRAVAEGVDRDELERLLYEIS